MTPQLITARKPFARSWIVSGRLPGSHGLSWRCPQHTGSMAPTGRLHPPSTQKPALGSLSCLLAIQAAYSKVRHTEGE